MLYVKKMLTNIFNIKYIGIDIVNNTPYMVLPTMNDVVTVYLLQDYNSYYSL